MRTRQLLAVSLVLVLVAAACSATNLTADDFRDQSFDNTDELVAWLDCDGQWTRMTGSMIGSPRSDWDGKKVVDTAREMMGTGDHPAVADAVRAGSIWVLVDEDGRPFGGLEPGHDLTFCSSG